MSETGPTETDSLTLVVMPTIQGIVGETFVVITGGYAKQGDELLCAGMVHIVCEVFKSGIMQIPNLPRLYCRWCIGTTKKSV